MEMESLRDIYVEELKDLWSAENQILKALPRMIRAVTYPQLTSRRRSCCRRRSMKSSRQTST